MQPSESSDVQNESPVTPQGATEFTTSDLDYSFKYYLHQWEQVRHCENMRSAFSLQLLTVAAGSVAGYFYFKGCSGLQVVLASVVISIGSLGFLVVRALENAANIHIRRARIARARIPRIEALAAGKSGFLPLARYFLALNVLIVIFGAALASMALVALPSPVSLTTLGKCAL